MNLAYQPYLVLINICSYLKDKDISSLSRSCKSIYILTKDYLKIKKWNKKTFEELINEQDKDGVKYKYKNYKHFLSVDNFCIQKDLDNILIYDTNDPKILKFLVNRMIKDFYLKNICLKKYQILTLLSNDYNIYKIINHIKHKYAIDVIADWLIENHIKVKTKYKNMANIYIDFNLIGNIDLSKINLLCNFKESEIVDLCLKRFTHDHFSINNIVNMIGENYYNILLGIKRICNFNFRINDDLLVTVACQYCNLEITKFLIEECDCDVKAQNNLCIIYACDKNNLELVKYLVSKGIDYKTRGYLAMNIAKNNNYTDIIKYFKSLEPKTKYILIPNKFSRKRRKYKGRSFHF